MTTMIMTKLKTAVKIPRTLWRCVCSRSSEIRKLAGLKPSKQTEQSDNTDIYTITTQTQTRFSPTHKRYKNRQKKKCLHAHTIDRQISTHRRTRAWYMQAVYILFDEALTNTTAVTSSSLVLIVLNEADVWTVRGRAINGRTISHRHVVT